MQSFEEGKILKSWNHFHGSGSDAVLVAHAHSIIAETAYTKGICVMRNLRQARHVGLNVHQVRFWHLLKGPRT